MASLRMVKHVLRHSTGHRCLRMMKPPSRNHAAKHPRSRPGVVGGQMQSGWLSATSRHHSSTSAVQHIFTGSPGDQGSMPHMSLVSPDKSKLLNLDASEQEFFVQQIAMQHNDLETYFTKSNKVTKILKNAEVNFAQGMSSSEITKSLFEEQYKHYIDTLPWLHRNVNIAYIQFLMNDHKTPAFEHIWSHPAGQMIKKHIEMDCSRYNNQEFVETFLALIYLGVDPTEPVITKLHGESQKRSREFNLHQIEMYGSILRSIKDRGYCCRPCLEQIRDIIKDDTFQWTPKDLYSLASISTLYMFIMSVELLEILYKKIFELMKDEAILQDVDVVAQVLRSCKRLRVLVEQRNLLPSITPSILRHNLALLSDSAVKLIKQTKAEHIAEICDTLKRMGAYNKQVALVFEQRALQLHKNANKLADYSNLMFCLKVSSKYENKKELANSVCSVLHAADVLILSDLAPCILDSRLSHHGLAAAYLALIPQHMDNLFSYVSRIQKIISCIQRFSTSSLHLKQQIAHSLVKCYSEKQGQIFLPGALAFIGSYVIPYCKHIACEPLISDIIRTLPQWNMRALYQLSIGLNSSLSNGSKTLHLKLSPLMENFYSAMMSHTKDINNLGMLYSIAMATIVKTPHRDPSFTHQMVQLFPSYTCHLSNKQHFIQTLNIFTQLKYYLPQVYDDLSCFLVERHEELHLDNELFLGLLRCLANAGYMPANHHHLVKLILDIYERMREEGESIPTQLVILRHLCYLQCLPETQLQHLFTLDMVEKIDHYLNVSGKHKQQTVEDLMMELNRFAVIECPQLDVPWFHDDHCLKMLDTQTAEYENLAVRQFRAEVGQALVEIVKEPRYFTAKTRSQYYHPIDFEVVTDRSGNLLTAEEVKNVNSKDIQRHAILILNKDSFCYDSEHLLGKELVRKRHLQILGYNVITVCIL